MAEIITHKFISAKSQSPDTTLVSKNEWNDGHTLLGGSNGQLIVFDNTQGENLRWTDGPQLISGTYALPVNPTASPLTGVAAIAFTANSPVKVMFYFAVRPVVTTGSVAFTINIILDGSPFGLVYSFASGSILSLPVITTLNAGAHTASLTFTAGASFTVAFVDLIALVLGA